MYEIRSKISVSRFLPKLVLHFYPAGKVFRTNHKKNTRNNNNNKHKVLFIALFIAFGARLNKCP